MLSLSAQHMGTDQLPKDASYAATITLDERLESQREINLTPVNSSWHAKWYHSTFHIVTTMVGAGILSLPSNMSSLGWGPGVAVLVLSWIITLYIIWQMVKMHEMVPGKRFNGYHELCQYAFGEKLGLYIVVPLLLVAELGVNIVYMVTGGQSLQKFYYAVCPNCNINNINFSYFIMIFGSSQFVLSHLTNFSFISGISLAATVMSIGYSTSAWAACLENGSIANVDYNTAGNLLNFFNALGGVAFAFAGQNVVMEIQAKIPSTPENPSKGPMWKGVVVAYIIVALCYFPVALIGYWVYGNQYVGDNILLTLMRPRWLIAMANLFVVFNLIGSYQMYAFDLIETMLARKLKSIPTKSLHFVLRNVYVASTLFVAMSLPFFNALLGFFGGFAFAPTMYFLPCIIWLKIRKPPRFSLSWWANWICILLGVSLMIVAPIGGLSAMISLAKSYKFYS